LLVVFTPTCRPGGIDVTSSGLLRQTYRDFTWIVGDTLYEQRRQIYEAMPGLDVIGFDPKREPDKRRDLAKAYNMALDMARNMDAEMFISLQDYIWIPDDGIERFVKMHERLPQAMMSGLTSFSTNPGLDEVYDIEGLYTIFAEPFTEEPNREGWQDVRGSEMWVGQDGYVRANFVAWEQNWAAVPRMVLESGLEYDEDFDYGVAYENQDFALRAEIELDAEVWVDLDNHAISLPHKDYWKAEELDDTNYLNIDRMTEKAQRLLP